MDILLVKDALLNFKSPLKFNSIITAEDVPATIPEYSGPNENRKKRIEHLRKLMGCEEYDWIIDVDLQFHRKNGDFTVDVKIKEHFLDYLHHHIYPGDVEEKLKLSLQLQVVYTSTKKEDGKNKTSSLTIHATELRPYTCHSSSGKRLHHGAYVQNSIPVSDGFWNRKKCDWKLRVVVDADDFISYPRPILDLKRKNRRILKEKRFCDLTIITGDGSGILCHKVFLSESPVLTAMIESTNDERKSTLTLVELSARGANAFLEFLYGGTASEAVNSAKVALELFVASINYDLPVLEQIAMKILLEKSCQWLDVDTAFRMYKSVRNCRNGEYLELKCKFIQSLLSANDLDSSVVFKEIFPKEVARELFIMVLNAKKH